MGAVTWEGGHGGGILFKYQFCIMLLSIIEKGNNLDE
jgi:hypothetical protein